MKRVFIYMTCAAAILLLAFVTSGCSEDASLPPPEKDNKAEDSYAVPTTTERGFEETTEETQIKLKDNVVYIREDLDKYIEEIDEEKGYIVFIENDILDKLDLKEGDILYSSVSNEKHPDGLCLRVTGKTETRSTRYAPGERLKFDIEPANFLEIHEDSYMCTAVPKVDEVTVDDVTPFDIDAQLDAMPIQPNYWQTFSYENGQSGFKLSSEDGKTTFKYGKWSIGYDAKKHKYFLTYVLFEEDGVKFSITGEIMFNPTESNITIKNGKFKCKGEFEWGTSLAAKFEVKMANGEWAADNYDQEKIEKLPSKIKNKLKNYFEKDFQLAKINIPFSPVSSLLVKPYFEVKVRLSWSVTGEPFVVEAGLKDGKIKYDIENETPYTSDIKTCTAEVVDKATPYLSVKGSLKGEAALSTPIGLNIEIPALKYKRKDYDSSYYTTTVDSWSAYETRQNESSQIGIYVMPEVKGVVKLEKAVDATNGILNLTASFDPSYTTYVLIEWLFGHRTHLFSSHEAKWALHDPVKLKTPFSWTFSAGGNIQLSHPIYDSTVETDENGDIKLEWVCKDNRSTYTVYVGYTKDKGTLRSQPTYTKSTTDLSCLFKPKTGGIPHYWFVDVKTAAGLTYESEVQSFTPKLDAADRLYTCPDDNHPHVIDMGMSHYFSCCNVGATTPTEIGDYYQWGSTTSMSNYQSTPYSVPNTDFLSGQNDVATTKWGAQWRMPSITDIEYLLKMCKWKWKENGAKVTSPTTLKSIFLPAGGFMDPYNLYNSTYGSYWGANIETSLYGSELIFGIVDGNNGFRPSEFYFTRGRTANFDAGRSIRPVSIVPPFVKW